LLEKDEVTQRVDGCSGLGFSLGVHKALYTLMTCRARLATLELNFFSMP